MTDYPSPVTAFVDQVARDKAAEALERAHEALNEVTSHERECAIRYDGIIEALGNIKKILAWAGTTVFALLVAVLGWLIVQQISRNDTDKELLRAQVEALQHSSGVTAR